MDGKWRQTKGPEGRPGIYVQDTAGGGKRYKVAYRDARGVVTSKTFEHLEDAKDFQDKHRYPAPSERSPGYLEGAHEPVGAVGVLRGEQGRAWPRGPVGRRKSGSRVTRPFRSICRCSSS